MYLAKKIMDLLIEQSKKPQEYINPNFLDEVTTILEDYYQLENDEVNEWIKNMWSY